MSNMIDGNRPNGIMNTPSTSPGIDSINKDREPRSRSGKMIAIFMNGLAQLLNGATEDIERNPPEAPPNGRPLEVISNSAAKEENTKAPDAGKPKEPPAENVNETVITIGASDDPRKELIDELTEKLSGDSSLKERLDELPNRHISEADARGYLKAIENDTKKPAQVLDELVPEKKLDPHNA